MLEESFALTLPGVGDFVDSDFLVPRCDCEVLGLGGK